jgi:hypothetical protein
MAEAWINVSALKPKLASFFGARRNDLGLFGSTVNQVFEAFVFAQVISWYQKLPGWQVELVNPGPIKSSSTANHVRLKFSTRGKPVNYTHAKCVSPNGEVFQIRHQLRVATRYHKVGASPPANLCLDVAVIADSALDGFSSRDYLRNSLLVSFGEAKHMSAFAELIAGFVGVVHELQPERLKRVRVAHFKSSPHPAPFLYVSGYLWNTAEGVRQTLMRRKVDLDIYTRAMPMSLTPNL